MCGDGEKRCVVICSDIVVLFLGSASEVKTVLRLS